MKEAKKNHDQALLIRILKLASPYRTQFFIAGLLAIVLAIVAVTRPYLIQITVDEHIMRYDFEGLSRLTIVIIALLLTECVFRYYFTTLTGWLGQSVIKDLRLYVLDKIIHLRLQYFDKTPIGTSTTRTIGDVETINEIFSEGIISIVADILMLLAIMGMMFYTDWKLTLVSLSIFPLLLYATYLFKEAVKSSFTEVRNVVARMNAFLQEHITGMKVIQIFTAEERELEKFTSINAEHRDANIKAIFAYSVFFPVVEVILAISMALMVWYGANQAIGSYTTLGTLTAFILYLNMAFRPLRILADKFNTLQMGMVAAERVFKILDNTEDQQPTGTVKAERLKGEIEFKNVWFSYNEGNDVLKNVSFSVKQGETIALVGATGAGKSSIINILNRFYEIKTGSITVDGVPLRDFDIYSLRRQVALVWQDVFLFSGSVMENITMNETSITKEKVIQTTRLVGADQFIEKLPGGYGYQVMERGATLSVGQRQLISFIRALVMDPAVLILDEATSSVDTESEELIQQAIQKMVKGRTSIVIAHRLSTIQQADKIIVLDKGEIVESGTHEELLERNGYYRKLYDMQFSKAA